MVYLVEMQTVEGITLEVLEAFATYPAAERRAKQLDQAYDYYGRTYRVVAMRVQKGEDG